VSSGKKENVRIVNRVEALENQNSRLKLEVSQVREEQGKIINSYYNLENRYREIL